MDELLGTGGSGYREESLSRDGGQGTPSLGRQEGKEGPDLGGQERAAEGERKSRKVRCAGGHGKEEGPEGEWRALSELRSVEEEASPVEVLRDPEDDSRGGNGAGRKADGAQPGDNQRSLQEQKQTALEEFAITGR